MRQTTREFTVGGGVAYGNNCGKLEGRRLCSTLCGRGVNVLHSHPYRPFSLSDLSSHRRHLADGDAAPSY